MTQTPQCFFNVSGPEDFSCRVLLAGGSMILGRASDIQIPLPARTVSRQHAEVFSDPFGRWWIKDLGSRNGTLVNGETIHGDYLLAPNDQIQIEEFSIQYEVVGELATRNNPRSATYNPELTVAIAETGPQNVTRLDQLKSPKIDASHLASLTDFSSDLLATEDPQERLLKLARLLVAKQFHGNTALAFQLDLNDPATPLTMLLEPQSNHNWRSGEEPYISRTLLNGIRQNQVPVIASNVNTGSSPLGDPEASDVMKLSLAGDVQQLAALACPIQITDTVMEVLYVTFPGEFGTPEWLALASLAVDQYKQAQTAWQARQQAQQQAILEKELQHASTIQNAMIPDQIDITGTDTAIGFEPCKWVGGDYVDVITAPNGKVYLTVCDVCGKGIQAAIITASLHCLFHNTATAGIPLADLMQQFNDYLEQMLPDESFVTAISMIYDPDTGHLQASNAGHPPAFIISADGKATELSSGDNPPLGFIPTPFVTTTHQLQPGELLSIFTDGLTESVNEANEMLNIDGVGKMLEQVYIPAHHNDHTQILCNRFAKLLDDYEGNAARTDDRTFLLLKRLP